MTAPALHAIKIRLGLTGDQLAQRLGVTRRHVWRLLAGHKEITGAVAVIARQLEEEAARKERKQ